MVLMGGKERDGDFYPLTPSEHSIFSREVTSVSFEIKCAEVLSRWGAKDAKMKLMEEGVVCINSHFPEKNLSRLRADNEKLILDNAISEALRQSSLPGKLSIPSKVFTTRIDMGENPPKRHDTQNKSAAGNFADTPPGGALICQKPSYKKEARESQNYETTFHLFVTDTMGPVIEVLIKSDNHILDGIKLEKSEIEKNAWLSKPVSVPVKSKLSYTYTCICKPGVFSQFWENQKEVKEAEKRVLKEKCLQFDMFQHSSVKGNTQVLAKGYFFKVLLSRVHQSNLTVELASDTVQEFVKTCHIERIRGEVFGEICCHIRASAAWLTPPQLLYCTVLLTRILPAGLCLDQGVAEALLRGIAACRTGVINNFDRNLVSEMIPVILYAKYEERWNLNHVIYHFVPAVDASGVFEIRQRYKMWTVPSECGVEAGKKVCLEKEYEKAQDFLQLALRSLDTIDQIVEVLQYMEKKKVDGIMADIGRKHALLRIDSALKKDSITLTELTDLWKIVEVVNDIPYDTVKDILLKMNETFTLVPKETDVVENVKAIRNVLKHVMFKQDPALGIILLKAFSKCKNSGLHLLGIDTLQCFKLWKEEVVVSFSTGWMDTAINLHSDTYGKLPSQRIPVVYNFLDILINQKAIHCCQRSFKCVKNLVEDFVKKYPCKSIIGVLPDLHAISLSGIQIYQEHVLKKIKNDLSDPNLVAECILALVEKERNILNIESRTAQILVETLLDQLRMTNTQEDYKVIVKYCEMWLAVQNSKGKCAMAVKQHRCMKIVGDLLQVLRRDVETLTIDPSLFKSIYKLIKGKKEKERLELIACFDSEQGEKDADYWKNVFEKADKILEELETKGKHIGTLFNVYLKSIRESVGLGMHDWEECQDLLPQKTKLSSFEGFTSMEHVSSEEFWGKLHAFVESSEALYEYASVTSFLLYCNNEIKSGALENFWSRPNSLSFSCLEVSIFLKDSCLKKFNKILDEMIMLDVDIDISKIEYVFTSTEVFKADMQVLRKIGYKMANKKKSAWSSYEEYSSYRLKVEALVAAAEHLGITNIKDEKNWAGLKQYAEQEENDVSQSTLYTLHKKMEAMRKILQKLEDGDSWEIVLSLSNAKNLITFLIEIPDENLLHLTDATEEHSEQHIQVSTVSDLILLHKALYHLLLCDRRKMSVETLIQKIIEISHSKTLGEEGKRNIPARIDVCVENIHGLKALYQNVANREELTKEIIESALKIGIIHFKIDDLLKECIFTLKYKKNKKEVSQSMQELADLRSRALLVANSEKKGSEAESLYDLEKRKEDMQLFVKNIEHAFQIADCCTLLHQSGHFHFQEFHREIIAEDTTSLQDVVANLQTKLTHWDNCLANARRKYYPLNFIWGNQLILLKDAIDTGKVQELPEAQSILRYIHPCFLKSPRLHGILGPSREQDLETQLDDLGRKLLSITEHLKPHVRYIQEPPCIEIAKLKMKPGKLYIALLDIESLQVIPVIMMLYGDTVKCFPEPSQILFCHEETSWEEIHLLLQRCFHPDRTTGPNELFCLVNLEVLQGEVQTQLVNEVECLIKQAEAEGRADFYLCFITRASHCSPAVDHFRKFTHRVSGLTDGQMEHLLHTYWPNTYMITSEVPGLGKSEYVKEKAALGEMGTSTISISGPFCRSELVSKFAGIRVQDHNVLHIDISMTPNPYSLDSFLFELIVVGAASSGTIITWLDTDKVAVEVANSIQDKLRNSLTFLHAFNRICLEWENYSNFRVCDEPNSSTQVVCQYLEAIEMGNIDEKNIYLIDKKSDPPIPERRCQTLLAKYFDHGEDMSFSVVMVFLDVLADQLKKMSASYFFRVENLKAMLGQTSHQRIRYTLVTALIDISQEFACRSVQSCRSSQVLTEKDEYEAMVRRVEGMIQWADSNHLMIVFQSQGAQTVSALYRNKDDVPIEMQRFFKSQLGKELEDFDKLDQVDLHKRVERLVQGDGGEKSELTQSFLESYALTPDNFLKMVLISLRIKAGVPVILMGETGCGKTSLIKYLAAAGATKLHIFNFHAGITETQIKERILWADGEARKTTSQYWLFLDEVNTCHHLGLLSEIICHHTCQGKILTRNLVMIAACNPYRLRGKNQIMTSGLKSKISTDPLSRLVYRVYPLPETMTDYVWDYGTLNEKDEMAYIERMMSKVFPGYKRKNQLVPVLVESQNFLRTIEETAWSVSLRDVNRCRNLMQWFYCMLQEKDMFPVDMKMLTPKQAHTRLQNPGKPTIDTRRCDDAVLLALAHCYFSRIHRNEHRFAYLKKMAIVMYPDIVDFEGKAKDLLKIIANQQMDLLKRMEIGKGIAKNTALRENVFVLFVSILNRIPVFVVGKPGCSKSLSMQLLRSSLRGPDSKDEYFKTLPQLYVVSHQGSESSTSEGVEKVFKKAEQYLVHNKDQNVLPVVLLDEIGLAEVSRFNPLKVLHSLLEPTTGEVPNVAVVGISNWALDAAKMNRAIHLSRPDLDEKELEQTAISIGEEYHKNLSDSHKVFDLYEAMAKAYFAYQKKQQEKNFHGLRDYYALIKYISKQEKSMIETKANEIIHKALHRNFGGMPMEDVLQGFLAKLKDSDREVPENDTTTKELIKENLSDHEARYLMLITDGEAATGIVESLLQELGRDFQIIIGSHFEEDQTEDYCYQILSRIILCMERGFILILKDLDPIYGSLYDMLNQNYTKSGDKLHCRVAIGPYSNPICHVHKKFRCIVLMDRKDISKVDPPFLNRFEKQQLLFSHIMTPKQVQIVKILTKWMDAFSKLESQPFTKSQCFLGYHKDLIPSQVITCKTGQGDEYDQGTESIEDCKQKLIMLATPDAVQRLKRSLLATTEHDVQLAVDDYFKRKIHRSLRDCVSNISMEYPHGDKGVDRIVIYTHSSIHVDVKQHLGEEFPSVIERLSSFSSEKQLASKIRHFWFESKAKYFLLQCKPSLDAEHILLAKYQIENCRSQYKQKEKDEKIVIFLMHLGRNEDDVKGMGQFSFLNGWCLVNVDTLENMEYPLSEFHDKSVMDILESPILPLSDVVKKHLLWAFTCIDYQGSITMRGVQDINSLIVQIANSGALMNGIVGALKRIIRVSVDTEDDWQVKVACDGNVLGNASSFRMALCDYIENIVKCHLAKLVYRLEELGIWDCFLAAQNNDEEDTLSLLEDWIPNPSLCDVRQIPDPTGPECYQIKREECSFQFPFVKYFEGQFEKVKQLFGQNTIELEENEDNLDEAGILAWECLHKQIPFYSDSFIDLGKLLLYHSYFKDHLDMYIQDMIKLAFPNEELIQLVLWILEDRAGLFRVHDPIEKFVLSHLALWYLDPLIFKLIKLANTCTSSIPSGSQKLKNLVSKRLEYFSRLQIVERNKSSTPAFIQDQSTSSTNQEEGEMAGLDTEEHLERTESQNRLDIDETALDIGTREDENGEENVAFIPNIPNIPTESDTVPLYPEEEKISNIDSELKDITNISEEADCASFDSKTSVECLLVNYLCREMYPTYESIEYNGGMNIWHGKAVALLASARSLNCQALCCQAFLSLCCDLTGMVLIPYNISQKQLTKLGDLGIKDKDGIMENPDLLEFILNLAKFKVPLDKCQQFLCMALSQFVQFDPDNCMIPTILEKAISGRMPDPNLNFFGPVLHNMLWSLGDDYCLFEIVCNTLAGTAETSTEIWGPLKYVDEELKKIQNKQVCRAFLILLVDMIEDLALMNMPEDIFQETAQGETFWDLLGKACEVTILSEELSLRIIVAVAFIKKAFSVLAEQIGAKEDETGRLRGLNMALSVSSEENVSATRKNILIGYFLNALKCGITYGNLKNLSGELSNHMSVLLDVEWSMKETILGLGFNPLASNPNFNTILEAWNTYLTEKKDQDLQAFLQKCISSSDHLLGFFGFVLNCFTLIRPVRSIKDTEKQQMFCIMENTTRTRFYHSWTLAVEKLLGMSDFSCQMLQLSEQSTLTQQQQASVLYHLIAVVVAHNPMRKDRKLPKNASIFAKCILAPQTVSRHNLPTLRDSSLNHYPLYMLDVRTETSVYTCKCGFIHLTRKREPSCQHCKRDSIEVMDSVLKESEKLFAQNKSEGESSESYHYVGTMNPLSYRVLHLLVQGSLLLAHALDFWPKEQELSSQELSMEAVLQRYETDWNILSGLLNETSEGVCRYIHMIIEKLGRFIAENENPCSSQEMKHTYEKEFSLLIQQHEKDRVQNTNKWYIRTCMASGYEQDGIESILGEVPNKNDEDIIPCLFRKKGTKSYESFRLQFMVRKKQMETPFLGYVLQFRKQLELLGHLVHLLRWHKEIITHKNKQLSISEAKEFTIEMFLHKSEDSRETKFQEFSKAWNMIRKPENLMALGFEDKIGFPMMLKGLPLKTCLITDVDSPLMMMIKGLLRVQNTTILQALRIALRTDNSSANMDFYRSTTEGAAAPYVYLQDASEKELMDFKWKDIHLAISQFNTGLGMGNEVIYDFKKIEKVVANGLLHGKSFLMLDENFPLFIFSGQLFHSHSSILQDLSTKIPQRNISQQIKSDLDRKSDEPDYAKRLLTHLEIVIPYVNRQGGGTTRSLTQYVETNFGESFKSTSKDLLPSHSDEIQLSHMVDLYEYTEALLVKTAVDSLDENFRKRLPEDSKILRELPDLESVHLEGVITAVGRVVKRYISSHQDVLKPDEAVLPFMEKPGIWPQSEGLSNAVTKILVWFEELQVCHIHHIYSLALESKEEKQPKEPLKRSKKPSRMAAKLTRRVRTLDE